MSKQIRVNVRTLVNASKIRREKRDGRDVIIVPSATLPDNVVMNGSGGSVMYPAEEIEKSFMGLEDAPAPLGHPMVNGKFVSARSPAGLARSYVGAHNENVRREGGRVFLDKVIDVEVANQSEGGRSLLSAIEKEEPIHTSTGLLATVEEVTNAAHKYVARNMYFDHDAILLNASGAATPAQGVGMFVNSEGDEIEVINSAYDDADRDLGWAIESTISAIDKAERAPLIEKIKMVIKDVIRGHASPLDVSNAQKGSEVDKEQFEALSNKVDAFKPGASVEEVTEIVANMLKPLTDAMEASAAAEKVKAEAEHATLVNKVVEAGLLTEELAKASPAPVLNALLEKEPKVAFRVNAAFKADGKKPDLTALAPKGE